MSFCNEKMGDEVIWYKSECESAQANKVMVMVRNHILVRSWLKLYFCNQLLFILLYYNKLEGVGLVFNSYFKDVHACFLGSLYNAVV